MFIKSYYYQRNIMAKKNITIVNEPFYVNEEGATVSFVPKEIKTYRDAYGASLHMLFKHVADIHLTLLDILADKYDIPVDDMLRTVQEDSRWKDIRVNPVINSCTYVDKQEPSIQETPNIPVPEPTPTTQPPEKKSRGRPKKVPITPQETPTPADESALVVQESTTNPVEQPKKKNYSIFAKLKAEAKAAKEST